MSRPFGFTLLAAILATGLAGCDYHGQHDHAHHGKPVGHEPTASHRLWIKERPIVVIHFRNAKRVYYHYTVRNDLDRSIRYDIDYKRRSLAARPYAKVVCGRHSRPCEK